MAINKTLIGIPTYNESKNIKDLVDQILSLENFCSDILIVDDNSPDGTGEIIDQLRKDHTNISVIHRKNKGGIGSAHLEIINYAYKKGYGTVITMDGDFSHDPKDLKVFFQSSSGYDVVIGSRFTRKESLADWGIFRKILTHLGHILTKNILQLPYDASGGLRLYNLENIPQIYFHAIKGADYEFFFTSLTLLHRLKCRILEIPIVLRKRAYGSSKMSLKHMIKGLIKLFYVSFSINKTILEIKNCQRKDVLSPQDEWDVYWSKEGSKKIYDKIATFYRFKLIQPNLDRFIEHYFKRGDKLLHAGCGSGETDTNVANYANLTAIDFSTKAIKRYKDIHKDKCQTMVGSIFKISVPPLTFDGIYNLGVMEHFSETEIVDILREFNRVLKVNGRVILFWPPSYGLSVLALRFIHFILNGVLRKNIKLHPDEPTRIRSKQQVIKMISKAGFKLEKFSFSIRDAFTYVVVVIKKE